MSLISTSKSLAVCLALASGPLLFSSGASGLSSKMHDYALNECAKTFCISANGDEAFVSFLSPTLAEANVTLTVTPVSTNGKGKAEKHTCSSMAYLLSSSLLTCEQADQATLVFDLANSTVVTLAR